MWNMIDSLWSSLALFLSALFFHGMILRSLRERKPNWFINNWQHHIIRYFIGMYYGVLGLYFILRGLPGTDYGVYTDMLVNIILILNLFSGVGPATIATIIIAVGKLMLAADTSLQLLYLFFIISFHLICIQVNTLKISLFQKFILSKLSITPFMLFYLHLKMAIPLQMEAIPRWLLFFGISFFCSLLLYLAAHFIDSSNKQIFALRQSAILDPLTNLANFRHFDNCLGEQFAESKKNRTPLSIIIFDIDFFKNINDTYGHQTGNVILSSLSGALQKVLFPKGTLIARIGGEEFAILLPNISRTGAKLYAEQLRGKIEKTDFPFNREDIHLTISVGTATMDELHDFESGAALLNTADKALYIAKENGRNRVHAAVHLTVPLKE
ncbi:MULTISPECIES: sensor domain-containing diguanylate cyclase [Listeria]|uniref:GGDEF domain-containing protein n=1 Tax=Listeria TaxID=1637 RepID=UPI000B596D5C|nr:MULTISPECIES: sensor domain-containing diguanylate cyclase [Listeria]